MKKISQNEMKKIFKKIRDGKNKKKRPEQIVRRRSA